MIKKNKFKTVKTVIAALLAVSMLAVTGCGNTAPTNSTESEVQTEVKEEIKVTFNDDNGNQVTLKGELGKDENGNTVINATDTEGNKVVANVEIKTDENGNTVIDNIQIKNPENTTIVADNKEQATVSKPIETVAVEKETKVEVVTKPAETQKPTETQGSTQKPTEKPTQKETESATQKETASVHTHNYTATTQVIHHDAVTHTETVQEGMKTVVDTPAWDEHTYNDKKILVCQVCGYMIDFDVYDEGYYVRGSESQTFRKHAWIDKEFPAYGGRMDFEPAHKAYLISIGKGNSGDPARSCSEPFEPGTYILSTVHHNTVTHQEPNYVTRTIVDKAAWDETVTVYKCSCGAKK